MRVFISINLPENIKEEIIKIQESLPEFEGKKTGKENLHLTLKFLGEINEKEVSEIRNCLGKIKLSKFEAKTGFMGIFDNRKSKRFEQQMIIWIGITNCEKLQKEVDVVLKGLFLPEKRFMGHLTIARVKDAGNKKRFLNDISKIEINKSSFIADKFYLMRSQLTKKQPVYSVVEEFNLR